MKQAWMALALLAWGTASSLLALGVTSSRAGELARPSDAEIGSVQVYLTPDQAIREIFPGLASVDTLCGALNADEAAHIRKILGQSVPSDTLVVLRPRGAGGDLLGYAVIAEEIGKYRPITFMVGTSLGLEVRDVEVLVYRESRGGEVRMTRFLRQYRGKSVQSAIRSNKDILNVAGATLSVNALNLGVKRVLLSLDALKARKVL